MNNKFLKSNHIFIENNLKQANTLELDLSNSNSSYSSNLSISSDNSSFTSSSDDSNEFNEVEKVIEDYFVKKFSKSEFYKLQNWNCNKPLSYNFLKNQDVSCNIVRDTKTSADANVGDDYCIETVDIATQVTKTDFLKTYQVLSNTKRLFKSRSYAVDVAEIQNYQSVFLNYLKVSSFDNDFSSFLQNSKLIFPKLVIKHFSEDNCSKMYHQFVNPKTLSKKFNQNQLQHASQSFSPLKAVLMVERETSKILMANGQAKTLLQINNLDSQYLSNFIVTKYKTLYNLDYSINKDGNIYYFPSKIITLQTHFGFHFPVSIQFHTFNYTTPAADTKESIIVIFEPLKTNFSLSLSVNDTICYCNKDFNNFVRFLKNQQETNADHQTAIYLISQLKNNFFKTDQVFVKKQMHYNQLNFIDQTNFYYLTWSHVIDNPEYYKEFYKLEEFICDDKNFHYKNFNKENAINAVWFYSNISNMISISDDGLIVDIDFHFSILLNYSKEEYKRLKINEIMTINSVDGDILTVIRKGTGKYDAEFHDKNGCKLNAVIWIERNNLLYILWVVRVKNDFNVQKSLNFDFGIKTESVTSLKSLLEDYTMPKMDQTPNLNEQKLDDVKQDLVEDSGSKLTKVTNNQKKKAYSMPETSICDQNLSLWSPHPSLHLQQSNASSNETDVSQDMVMTKDIDLFYSHFEVLNVIGKGAFGYVRLTKSLLTGKEFVVKFIRKCKLSNEHMTKVSFESVFSFKKKRNLNENCDISTKIKPNKKEVDKFVLVPKEIWMLCNLNHENIISLYDWYDGTDHFQMIMPKHGIGMDLFEFIDRAPSLDEPLVSFIFRQLVNAINYLHDMSIAHRDIKDENIILDDQFKIKLIDFGAAVIVEPGQKFKTFCGTMEFCSPEILLGQEYNCFCADIWSMGITLYTIMFGENPFYDFEETISATLKPPKPISQGLKQVLSRLLEPNPDKRASLKELEINQWVNQPVDMNEYIFDQIIPNIEFMGNVASDFRKCSGESNFDITLNKSSSN